MAGSRRLHRSSWSAASDLCACHARRHASPMNDSTPGIGRQRMRLELASCSETGAQSAALQEGPAAAMAQHDPHGALAFMQAQAALAAHLDPGMRVCSLACPLSYAAFSLSTMHGLAVRTPPVACQLGSNTCLGSAPSNAGLTVCNMLTKARDDEDRRVVQRRRDTLILILRHLVDLGYLDAFQKLCAESGLNLSQVGEPAGCMCRVSAVAYKCPTQCKYQ